MQTLTLEIRDGANGYWASVKELPGCYAAGETMRELLESATESIALHMEVPAG